MISDLKTNLLFSYFAKPKTVCNPKNKELIVEMSRLGFSHIFLEVDAGSDFDRRLYNKSSSLEECSNALSILREAGIFPRYGLIFFNPYSTPETMRESYRFLVELKSANYYHYGGLRVQLLNGTRLLKKVSDDGLLSKDYSFMNTEGYHFLHHETREAADFMKFEFLPAADRIRNQFNTLNRFYYTVKHVSNEAENHGIL